MHKMHVALPSPPPAFMLLPGDPGRVPVISSGWRDAAEVSWNREFRVAYGTTGGVPIGVCSTGIGAPSTEIALVELAAAGTQTFVRVGMCGAIQPEIALGTLVIAEGAVRHTGASDAYCDRAYPAIADRDVTLALIEACEELGYPYAVGLTASTDSFFAGQNNPLPESLAALPAAPVTATMQALGVLTFEMEASALFVLGRLLGRRCGSICSVESNRATGERRSVPEAIGNASRAASRAVELLAGWDRRRTAAGRRSLSATLLAATDDTPPPARV